MCTDPGEGTPSRELPLRHDMDSSRKQQVFTPSEPSVAPPIETNPGRRTQASESHGNQHQDNPSYVAELNKGNKKPSAGTGKRPHTPALPAAEKERQSKSHRPWKKRNKGLRKNDICIATINVRGLGRQQHKVDALCLLLEEQKVDVCVVTETHMSYAEVEAFHINRYTVIAKSCRTDAATGGVFILVSTELDAEEIQNLPKYPPLLSICSLVIYPHETEAGGIRITGVYISPSAKTSASDIEDLTQNRNQTYTKEGELLNHLILGDLNPNSWKGEKDSHYQDWLAEKEVWELTNPILPTHTEGSALDKVLLLPGWHIPWELLPPDTGKGIPGAPGSCANWTEDYYPAETYPCPCIADHHPIFLRLTGTTSSPRPPIRKLQVHNITKEEWMERDEALAAKLKENQQTLETAHRSQHTERYYSILIEAVQEILADKYRKIKAPKLKQKPYKSSQHKHRQHPDMPQLIKAKTDGDTALVERLTNSISRDHWKESPPSI